MRVSSTLFFRTGLDSINAQQSDLLHLYKQIGTGKRLLTPSDDPLASAQTINLSQSQSLNERFSENRQVAMRSLGTAESTLGDATLLMQDIKTRLVEASNGTLSDADRSTLATVLQGARDSLLGMANARDGAGQYVFSGSKGDIEPFQQINGNVVYKGDQVQRLIQADQTRQIAGSDVGLDVFARATPGSSAYLTRMEPVAGVLPQGTGQMGGPQVQDVGHSDYGKALSVAFKDDAGVIKYTVSVKDPATGSSVSMPDERVYDPANPVLDLSTTNANSSPAGAQQAMVKVSFEGIPANGDTFVIEPASSPGYVSSVQAASGSTLKVSSSRIIDFAVAKPGYTYDLEFTSDAKFDVIVRDAYGAVDTSQSMTGLDFIPGRENTIDLPYGMQVKLTGTPKGPVTGPPLVPGDKVSIVPNETPTDLNIFDALDNVIAALKGDVMTDPSQAAQFRSAIATAMQRTDVVYDNILTVRSSVGTRLNELESLDANGAQRGLGYAAEMTRLEDLDYYTATTQLQLRSSALEAASLAFRRIQSLSLFNQGQG